MSQPISFHFKERIPQYLRGCRIHELFVSHSRVGSFGEEKSHSHFTFFYYGQRRLVVGVLKKITWPQNRWCSVNTASSFFCEKWTQKAATTVCVERASQLVLKTSTSVAGSTSSSSSGDGSDRSDGIDNGDEMKHWTDADVCVPAL